MGVRGPSQFQQLSTLSPPFFGDALREESLTAPLRVSCAGQRLPRGPLWPFTGSPQVEQHAGLRFTGVEVWENAIGAMAQAEDIMGVGEMAMVEANEAVAGMEATEPEVGEITGTAEAEAGVVAAGTVVGEGEMAGTMVTLVMVEATGAVARMVATDAEAEELGATEAGAGVVAAETVAIVGITEAEEEMVAEGVCFALC